MTLQLYFLAWECVHVPLYTHEGKADNIVKNIEYTKYPFKPLNT